MKLNSPSKLFLLAGVVVGTLLNPASATVQWDGPSENDLQNFKERGHIKSNANLRSQMVSSSVEIDGEQISLADADLTPFRTPYTADVRIVINGVRQATIASRLFRSTRDSSVIVAKHANGELSRASKMNGGRVITEVLPVEKGSTRFVEVRSDAIDADEVNSRLTFADVPNPEVRRSLRQGALGRVDQVGHRSRSLQGDCPHFKVIEIAIVFDNTFCAYFGNDQVEANDHLTQLIDGASLSFQQDGICTKIKISDVEGYCDYSNDPYQDIVNTASKVCGSEDDSLLGKFRNFWEENRNDIHRDTTFWFSGSNTRRRRAAYLDPPVVAGCAFAGSMCGPSAYGVNKATEYTYMAVSQQNFVTNLLGLNAGSNPSASNFMMDGATEGAFFGEVSANNILSHLSSSTCITIEKPICGDGFCTTDTESTVDCPQDCGTSCGDGACNGDESSLNCKVDCATPTSRCAGGSREIRVCSSLPDLDCGGSEAECSEDTDCCSSKCNVKLERCVGDGRRLGQQPGEEGNKGFLSSY